MYIYTCTRLHIYHKQQEEYLHRKWLTKMFIVYNNLMKMPHTMLRNLKLTSPHCQNKELMIMAHKTIVEGHNCGQLEGWRVFNYTSYRNSHKVLKIMNEK